MAAALPLLALLDAGAPPPARSAGPAVALRVRDSYEAGAKTARTSRWVAGEYTANDALLGNLTTIRNRSRLAARNNGYAKAAIERFVTNVVGTGMTMRSKAEDKAFRVQADSLFERWSDYSDADGLLEWCGQQTQATRAWADGGEVFIRLRPRLLTDGLPVPLQLQIIEAEQCPHAYTQQASGARIRAGIEFNAIGQRVAYYFHPSRPDVDDFDRTRLVRIPAEFIVHLYDPLRPGQLRGLPRLTQALVRLHDLDKFDDAVLLRQQIANLFAGFIKRTDTPGDTAINPLTGSTFDSDASGDPMVSLEPATMQMLEPGEEVQWSDPPDAGSTYEVFMQQQLRAACVSAEVPYELVTGDMRGLNDRIMRVILGEFRRRVMAVQHQLLGFQLCRRVWLAFMDRAFYANALPIPASYATDPSPWSAVVYAPHGWPYLNPVQDVEASRAAIRAGLTTRAAVVAEQGDNVEDIDQQNADDNARADRLGVSYDSDGRRPVNGSATKPAADEGTGDPTGANV